MEAIFERRRLVSEDVTGVIATAEVLLHLECPALRELKHLHHALIYQHHVLRGIDKENISGACYTPVTRESESPPHTW